MVNAMHSSAGSGFSRKFRGLGVIGAIAAVVLMSADAPTTQKPPERFNRAIDKLVQGKVAFGTIPSNRSIELGQSMARSDLDFLMIDMEHGSMDMQELRIFMLGMIDSGTIVKRGTPQPTVTPMVRLPQYGREPLQFMIKQALDLGVFGIVFPTIETKEQALNAVRAMRYPQPKGSPYMEPFGQRGAGNGNAVWYWGVPTAEYQRRADLWPLNPDGELLAIMMIESAEGLKNAAEIAAVPGVGGILIGPGDMSFSLGVGNYAAATGGGIPEVEAAVQTVLKVCLARKIPCGSTGNANDVARRIKEGMKFFVLGGGGLSAGLDAALRAGRAADK